MKSYHYFFLILFCFFLGAMFFAFYNKWIIVRYPSYGCENQHMQNIKSEKKDAYLIFWNNKKWNKEKISLLWSADKAKNMQYLINSWLTLLDEEQIMKKKVSLQAVLLSSSGQNAYFSFDRNPFSNDSNVYEKWMWIEGLLKTIAENDIKVQDIQFLVHHHIMSDDHLDFSRPWPLYGFLPLPISI